jgi:alkylation response protein AidB-like acyl-CoA dehydrogenase
VVDAAKPNGLVVSASDLSAEKRRQQEIAEADELLFASAARPGFAKSLFFGKFLGDRVLPYPALPATAAAAVEETLPALRAFLRNLDPAVIDRQGEIPREIVDELAKLGVLGMTAPAEFGGRGWSQGAYCRVMQEIGARCASTAIFVNAHHSIGMRALLLFGTAAQKRRWLPALARGETLAAFALTEEEAGSDAANIQTQAQPSTDGNHYVLNGTKRYITNGSTAGVLTVMARTPGLGGAGSAVTAFLVTPDMPGFTIVEPRMQKLGVRGTVTARLAFRDMQVPAENILGAPGKGLKIALTVLDFGRTTFGACCTGATRTCLELATAHAKERRQFGRTLGEFELVKKKIADIAASAYAMEAMTTVTASMIDRGLGDYMVETAMLKLYSTEALWTAINDAFQIHGGAAYFTDRPLERMLRDARINQIGEGANEVLASFIALVGLREPGAGLQAIQRGLRQPGKHLSELFRAAADQIGVVGRAPAIPVRHPTLRPYARELAGLIRRLGLAASHMLICYREEILDRQYAQDRLARTATLLYACVCVLSRLDAELPSSHPSAPPANRRAAELFLRRSFREMRRLLAELRDNDDAAVTAVADQLLR